MYYRRDSVLQKETLYYVYNRNRLFLYYRKRLSTTGKGFVLKKGFCTTERDSLLQERILYYGRDSVLQNEILSYVHNGNIHFTTERGSLL